jgi:hypothetical protein
MTTTDKITKIQELNNEIKSIQSDFKPEMINFILDEFKKRGFVIDPRGESYGRGLYNPELKISIWVGNVTNLSVAILVTDMVDDGMNWGVAYKELKNGCDIRFNYLKQDFEKFYNTTFKNRVTKLEDILKTK